MSSEIVTLKDGQPVTTSLIVADVFDKRHFNVLRDIDNILASKPYQARIANGTKLNFEFCYQTNKLANNKPVRYCEMDRQGFELLAMGFTGEKAMEWKLKYSDAFAFMESALRRQSATALPNFDESGQVAYSALQLSIARVIEVTNDDLRVWRNTEKPA